MANLRNEFEFRSALLTALGQEHTEAEAKNEEMWRRKMLDGLGVEYDQNDVNQFGLFREKLIEGVTSKSEGGGGGSSDFSTAQVTLIGKDGVIAGDVYLPITLDGEDGMPDVAFFQANYVANQQHTYNAIMYKGATLGRIANTAGRSIESIIGNAQDMGNGLLLITGDCTITIS